MALNWVRGFRRLGWVLVGLGTLVAAFVAADFSKEVVGFDAKLIKSDFRDNPFSPALTVKILEFEKSASDPELSRNSLQTVCEDPDFKKLANDDKRNISS
jgi:hypothetical protein